MKLKTNNGMVPYIMVAGKDNVSGEMPEKKAELMIRTGPKRASNRFPGYPVCVQDKYYFAAEPERGKSKRQQEKTNA